MSDTTKQLLFVVIMAILLLLVVPIFESRTGKSFTELFFGIRKKKRAASGAQTAAKKEPHINNGSKGELTAFVAQLIRFANKYKLRLVAPGTVEYQGKTARLTSILVAPGGMIGIYCLGYGGEIGPGDRENDPWKQHMNGQDTTFDNPVLVCQDQYKLVASAMEAAGIQGSIKIVTVFTNPRATLHSYPASVYTQKRFMEELKGNTALRSGTLDIEKTALALADLANVKKREQEAAKKRSEQKKSGKRR